MLHAIIAWLGTFSVGATIRSVDWIIPTLQVVHIVCLSVVFFSAVMLDLRLAGVVMRREPLAGVADRLVPWIWYLLVALLATGALLIIAEPRRALSSPAFALKMVLLAIACATTLCIHRPLRRDAGFWELPGRRRVVAKFIGVVSMLLWVGIIFSGRWIAYTYQ